MLTQSQLILFFESDHNITSQDFAVSIDEVEIEFRVVPGQIVIDTDVSVGVHLLKLRSLTNKKIEITEVQLDRASIRQALYLSFLENVNGDRVQPCTATWEPGQIWILPFGNPMSFWIESTLDRIPHGQYGQNLYKNFNIWYPSVKVDLPDNFSTVVKDFFKYDFGFLVRPRGTDQLRHYPVVPLNLDLSCSDKLVDEYQRLESMFVEKNKVLKNASQNQYNALESPDWSADGWHRVNFYTYNEKTGKYYHPVDPELTPALWNQIHEWNIQDYIRVNITCLEPGSYASPHKDGSTAPETNSNQYDGCCQLYIPLDFPNDSYTKLSGSGLVDTTRANAINITDNTHCVVNNSDRRRYVLTILCNIESNRHLIDNNFLVSQNL
jgi:hypothetical protein